MKIWFNGNMLRRLDRVKSRYQTTTEFVVKATEKEIERLEKELEERERNGKRISSTT